MLHFQSSSLQKLSEVVGNLVNLKNAFEQIINDPVNPGQYLGINSFDLNSNSLVEHYFYKLMPPEPSRDERRRTFGSRRKTIKNLGVLAELSELVHKVELCKHTLDDLKKYKAFNGSNDTTSLFTSCTLDIYDVFPDFKENETTRDIIHEYEYRTEKDDYQTDIIIIDVPLCVVCSSTLKKYIAKYETY